MTKPRRFHPQGALPAVEPRSLCVSLLLHAALLIAGLVFGGTQREERVLFRIHLETVRDCAVEASEEERKEELSPVEALPLPELLAELELEDPEDPWEPELFIHEEELVLPEEPIPLSLWLERVLVPEETEIPEEDPEERSSERPAPSARPTPIPGENRPPRYPARAIRLGWQGRVLLEVHVGDRGKVLLTRVLESSGHGVLDRAAVKGVEQWRYQNGPGVVQLRVSFVIGG